MNKKDVLEELKFIASDLINIVYYKNFFTVFVSKTFMQFDYEEVRNIIIDDCFVTIKNNNGSNYTIILF
jgi:hypothetical protein